MHMQNLPSWEVFLCFIKSLHNMTKEILITLPKRGLRIIPPAETQANMLRVRGGEVVTWSEEEKIRLKMLINCPILAKRHPDATHGNEYMKSVDLERRNYLFGLANELSEGIVNEWHKINPNRDIAVLLYGSVAKGLTRRADHPDPSNIDLAVMGNIEPNEKEKLFDEIRCKRAEVQKKILSSCPTINSQEQNPGNAGVIIQDLKVVSKGNYSSIRAYITSCAIPLHDPARIWVAMEMEALKYMMGKRQPLATRR